MVIRKSVTSSDALYTDDNNTDSNVRDGVDCTILCCKSVLLPILLTVFKLKNLSQNKSMVINIQLGYNPFLITLFWVTLF